MAAARYWRIVGLSTVAGGDLELSELHLHNGATRVGAALVPSCSHAPTAGALANLSDGSLGSVCRFAGEAVRSGGFWIEWDFGGSPANVTLVRPGASTDQATFLAGASLQSRAAASDAWSDPVAFGKYPWPGASTLLALTPFTDNSVLRLHGDGANGSTTITDSSPVGRTPSAVGGASISTNRADAYGGAAIKISGSAPLTYAHTADLVPATDFCVRLRLWVPATSGTIRNVLIKATMTGHRPYSITLLEDGSVVGNCSNTTPTIIGITSARKVAAKA